MLSPSPAAVISMSVMRTMRKLPQTSSASQSESVSAPVSGWLASHITHLTLICLVSSVPDRELRYVIR